MHLTAENCAEVKKKIKAKKTEIQDELFDCEQA